MEIYYMLGDGTEVLAGSAPAEGRFHVPLDAVYAGPYELFLYPTEGDYSRNREPLKWMDMQPGHATKVAFPLASNETAEPDATLHISVSAGI